MMGRFSTQECGANDMANRPHNLSAAASIAPAARTPSMTVVASDALAIRWGIIVTALVALFGIIARLQIMVDGLARPLAMNVFFRLYAMYEKPMLLLLLAFAVLTAVLFATRNSSVASHFAWPDKIGPPGAGAASIIATLVFAVAVLTTRLVLHSYSLSMDEFSADFQARLFAHGQYEAVLPAFWRPFAPAMLPVFTGFRGDAGSWLSVYLPLYALIKAPFVAIGAGALLNPLLAALSIVVLVAIVRKLWPNERLRPWVAVALLATSSEFIVTSATAYSMPAHLFLNLLWFWLYLRGDSRSWIAALAVGVLALGLHNPFPHALFVAPFLIRLLRDGRWRRLLSAVVVYGIASVLGLAWFHFVGSSASGSAGLLSTFAWPDRSMLWLQLIDISLLFTWQAPIFAILVLATFIQARRLTAPLADLAWGVLLTLALYTMFRATQGHGWGYRYVYQVLGNLVVLAAAAAPALRNALGRRRADLVLAASLLIAAVIQLPRRSIDVERFAQPFAAGAEYIRTRPADVVLVHGDSIWYGRDLLRNDPFLRGQPVVLQAGLLSPAGRAALERAHPGRVLEVHDSELLRLGMTPWTHH
jgi:hypothetical protein